MIVCGVHFDEGRMFDLLRRVKGDPALSQVLFVPVLGALPANSSAMGDSIRSATATLGADGFIDLSRMSARLSQREVAEKLREMTRQALAH
jgi:hypothetical protein